MKFILKILIRGYQICLSPFVGNSCKFYPTCSHYSLEALEKYGVIKAVYLTIKRILRCNPWSKGGIDLP